MDSFKVKMDEIFKEAESIMVKKYKEYVSGSLDFIGSDSINLEMVSDLSQLASIKKNFNIALNDDDSIEVSPSFNPVNENIEKDLESFKTDLVNTIEDFSKKLGNIRFYNTSAFNPEIFNCHEKIGNKLLLMWSSEKTNFSDQQIGHVSSNSAQRRQFGEKLLHGCFQRTHQETPNESQNHWNLHHGSLLGHWIAQPNSEGLQHEPDQLVWEFWQFQLLWVCQIWDRWKYVV